ncbi:MAG: CinA family protein [Bacilli bacterium]|nr:CinA family protein [Bacilli bacterium]
MNNIFTSNDKLYKTITELLIKHNLTISTMESCTAGLIATLLTNTEGASAIMKGAFVTYSNEAKIIQGVSEECITKNGVYSVETALEMARACKKAYNSNIGIGVTGIIDRPDPNNPSDNGIYYAIIINDKEFTHKYIPDSNIERFEQKNYIANNIGVYLIDMLYEELGE